MIPGSTFTSIRALTLLLCLAALGCSRSFPDSGIYSLLLLPEDVVEETPTPTTPSVSSVSPTDGTTQLSVLGDTFTITFSEEMDPNTITALTVSGTCSGTIQLSSDNFASCAAGTLTTSDNIAWSFTPTVTNPTAGLQARLRVTTDARSVNEVALESEYVSAAGYTLFTPTDIAGITLWLHADGITGLTDTAAISVWTDNSGQSNSAIQATAANRPLYRDTAGPNNMPWVEFQSANMHFFDLSEFMSFTDPTVFVVGHQTTGAAQFFFSDFGAALPSRFNIGVDNANQLHVIIAETAGAGGTDIFGGAALAGTAISAASNGMTIISVSKNGVAANVYLDGTQFNAPTTATDATFDNTTQWDGTSGVDNPRIGKRALNALGDYLNGGIAEIIMYNTTLSDANRQRVECYLSRKYSIAGPTC